MNKVIDYLCIERRGLSLGETNNGNVYILKILRIHVTIITKE